MTNPRLVAVAGPVQGRTFLLSSEGVSIGRGQENHVDVPSTYVSRRHCVVEKFEGRYRVRDLGSSNGTVLNDLPVKEKWLDHGDRLRIGDALFLFLADDGEDVATSGIQLRTEGDSSGGTSELDSQRVSELQRQGASGGIQSPQHLARHLSALFKLNSAIASMRSAGPLQHRLLQVIMEVFGADRGALFLKPAESEEIETALGLERGSEDGGRVEVCPEIARRAAREGVAILVNDRALHTTLAAPLAIGHDTMGAIYLESADALPRYEIWDLELLAAIAGIASVALENARHLDRAEAVIRRLRSEVEIKHAMVGDSQAIKKVHSFIARVAPADSAILLIGESGTGKELVVRAIHDNSRRARNPFVAVNCAALVETLLESELFGHEKGAFTGAIAQKKGKFELAHGGTLFLDEVAELSPALQAKLLRVLEAHQCERVGGMRSIACDIRVIAATNRDLKAEARAGRFREDLYHRLNVVSFTMPPLRERKEDIPLLANHFAVRSGVACNRRVWGVSDEALACLTRYPWPGNIRELQNAIERAVVMGTGEFILPEDLPEAVLEWQHDDEPALTRFHGAVRDRKRELVLSAFKNGKGSFIETARLLGIHPNSLHRLVRNLNLRPALKESR